MAAPKRLDASIASGLRAPQRWTTRAGVGVRASLLSNIEETARFNVMLAVTKHTHILYGLRNVVRSTLDNLECRLTPASIIFCGV